MKRFCALNLFLTIALFVGISILPLPAESGGDPPKESMMVEGDALVVCPEPRPEICTMDYNPVCGQLQDGSFKVYSNGCGACSDKNVVGYREGECSDEK